MVAVNICEIGSWALYLEDISAIGQVTKTFLINKFYFDIALNSGVVIETEFYNTEKECVSDYEKLKLDWIAFRTNIR